LLSRLLTEFKKDDRRTLSLVDVGHAAPFDLKKFLLSKWQAAVIQLVSPDSCPLLYLDPLFRCKFDIPVPANLGRP
jgi:hypothetical protein